ncbi:MAG: protein-disulfide reductase DsbD domain-containing protein [Verrucomicrobiales bacterium]
MKKTGILTAAPFLLALAATALAATGSAKAAESAPHPKPGLKRVQLVTPASAVTPGEPLAVGLILDPEPGFHTYWKGPGSVGVATTIEWNLPEGFEAGEILWPPPEKTKMAGITAYGYRSETCLLTDIATPEEIDADEVTIRAKVGWMACATTCHPGLQNLTMTLPVNRSETSPPRNGERASRFKEIRASVPPPAPSDWTYELRLAAPDRIELDVFGTGVSPESIASLYFFSFDHQVDSDEPQTVSLVDADSGAFRLELVRPNFAPSSPEALEGVLHHPDGWPGIDASGVEISVPWPDEAFPDE